MYDDILFNEINTNIMNNDNSLYNPYEGYMKGNLFKNLYNEYKDYKPSRLIPNNEQAEMLLNINQISFMNQDIRLYLDINPNDRDMINKYNENIVKLNELIKMYENKYGPILCTSKCNSEYFSWGQLNFPWEEVSR